MKRIISLCLTAALFAALFCGCGSTKIGKLKNTMTETERNSITVGPLSLLDNTYAYSWEFNREATEKIKDSVREISIYDEELDSTFIVHVTVPPDYKEGKTYPAFVMTDGVWRFGNHPALWNMMQDGKVEDVLLVSIGYDFSIDGTSEVRAWFLCEKKEALLDFITDNLMPYLNETYSIDFSRSAIYGHSSGGTFTHYAVCHSDLYENQPFQYYIIGSPAFWSPYFLPFQDEPGEYKKEYGYFDRNKALNKELYICAGKYEDPDYEDYYGENDTTLEGVEHLVERLDSYGYRKYVYELYDSHHYQYIPKMFEKFFLQYYGK